MSTCSGILEDQDIAGLGVRIAIYAQSFLTVVAALIPESDITNSFWTLTVTSIALVISAVVQTAKGHLSLYNAILVTYLCVLHSIASAFVASLFRSKRTGRPLETESSGGNEAGTSSTLKGASLPRRPLALDGFIAVIRDPLAVPLYLQIMVVYSFGFHVWFNAASFGSQSECNADTLLLFFGYSFPALGTGRIIALVSLTMVLILMLSHTVSLHLSNAECCARRWMRWVIVLRGFAFAVSWVYVVVTVETTIRRNPVIHGDVQWTFGQVFPLVSILIPLVTVYHSGRRCFEGQYKRRGEGVAEPTP